MPIIDETGRKTWRIRLLILGMYLLLALFGVTMAYPFLITLTSSTTNAMDYNRFAPLPRGLWSREERFVRGIATYFPENLRNGMEQFNLLFGGLPDQWMTWKGVGDDGEGIHAFAQRYLSLSHDPARWGQVKRMAADYAAFARQYPLSDSVCAYNERRIAPYFRERYLERLGGQAREDTALAQLSQRWGVTYETFYQVSPSREYQAPWDQPNYWPPADTRDEDFTGMRAAYRDGAFMPGAIRAKWRRFLQGGEARKLLGISGSGTLSLRELNQSLGTSYRGWGQVPYPVTAQGSAPLHRVFDAFVGTTIPASETRPFPLKTAWLRYLGTPETRAALGLSAEGIITVADYNQAFGTRYMALRETPFPVPASAPRRLRQLWETFVQTQYPKRLLEIAVTPQVTTRYQQFVRERFRGNLANCNKLLGTRYSRWGAVTLPARMPVASEMQSNLWMDFVGLLPVDAISPRSAEAAYQRFLLDRYGSLSAINHAYGRKLSAIEQAEMPFDMAYLVTFAENEWPLYSSSLTENYRFVLDYLVFRGRAVLNTVVLIFLTVLAALTVNPLAAYALSRFQMRQMPGIILFLLATM
ncbi:MAG TPA: hypothetical protein VGM23_16935, partial [Armatimonadota bacterium]